MIKNINHQNFLTTPFVAAKSWHLHNDSPDGLVILESTGSSDTVALEYVDYSVIPPVLNNSCSIALEQQDSDLINYQEGIEGYGKFYPDQEPTNHDGTFKRLVHSQTKAAFYNKNNDPTKIFGMEFIDFPLGQTFRDLTPEARLFNVPQIVFGERILENSLQLVDHMLDDNVEVIDDGYQNLIATQNLFSKIQEVRTFGNDILIGSVTNDCFSQETSSLITLTTQLLTLSSSVSSSLFYTASVKLNWSYLTDESLATGVNVARSTYGSNIWTDIATLPVNTSQSYDLSLLFGFDYFYRVYTFNTSSILNYSNVEREFFDGAFDTFENYSTGQLFNFNKGTGSWENKWKVIAFDGLIAADDFEEYAYNQTSSFDAGFGWDTNIIVHGGIQLSASESFDEYANGQSSNFNLGYGFDTPWTII